MKESQALEIFRYLRGAYPSKEVTRDMIGVWSSELLPLEFDSTFRAVQRLARSSKWWPSIAEICEASISERMKMPSPEEAWRLAKQQAMFQSYQGMAGEAVDDPLIQELVDSVGVRSIMMDQTQHYARLQFLKSYEAALRRRLDAELSARHGIPPRTEPGEYERLAGLVPAPVALPEGGGE